MITLARTLVLIGSMIAMPRLATAEDSRMSGRVIDADSQAPIADAEVELVNASGGTGFFRARTDRNGQFRLDGIVADRYYTLTVGAEGYADFVLGGWRFPAAQRAVDVLIPLDRAGSIEVQVTAADGRTPIAAAKVSVRSESPSPWWEGYRPPPPPIYTDARGNAVFRGLTAGYWTVTAEASGRLTHEARRVAVRRGEATRVPAALARPASISGTVHLADGTGVAGVSVIARGPAEGVGTTDADGGFTVPDLPPGKYRLEVQPEGFEPARSREAIALAEGESKPGITLTVTPRSPELAFVLNREVFAPDDPVQVGLRSFRIGEVTLTLWRIPIERVLDTAQDFRRYAVSPDTTGLLRERTWAHSTTEGPAFAWRDEMVTVPTDSIAGVYVLSGRAGDLERRVIFFVSELGLIVKRSPSRLLVSAASLKTSVQAEGVAIFTAPAAGPPVRRPPGQDWQDAVREARRSGASTGADGLIEVPLPAASPRLRVVGVSERLGVSVVEAPLAPAAEQGGDQVFLYTERPLYRPGQKVFWKLFARKAADSGYRMPEATTSELSLLGPDGTRLEVPTAPLSNHGTADGSIDLAADLPLGEWTLSARVGGASGTATFGVQAYRKPEFSVEVTPDREVYVNGDEVRFKVAATYFFGAPVFGAAVRYNLFESRLARDDEEDWEWNEMGTPPEVGFGRVLKTGEARTDADGRVALTFVPERVSYDRRLTLEVEVVDPANRMVRGRGSAVMGRGLFVVRVRPTSRLVPVGAPILIEVTTVDHAGKPVAAAVAVELDQDAWNPIERRTTRSTRPLATTQVTTDANGRATVSLTPAPARSGQILVRARAEDAKGNRITDEASLWVYDPKVWQYAYRYPALEALPDRRTYAPGDTARIVVNTDVAYAAVLATVEGREIEQARIVHLFGNTGLVEVAIRPEHAPNVYVSLHVRKGREVRSRELDLTVTGERHDLAIEVVPDRESYRPGDEARVRITTREPAGAPAPAEVSLGVVDEAIYSLRPDATRDPHDVFYGHRPNWVTTAVSFPSLTMGGAEKEGQEVRRDFRDVAYWGPVIRTDAEGRAEVTFRFPDNLTTWRFTSRGATDDTRVGDAVARTRVTKDLVARLALPRFFIAGDRAALVSVVTNRTAEPLVGVKESIEARGPVKTTGETSAETSIPARGESRHEWTVEVGREMPAAGDTVEATFVYRARSSADSDALEVRAPVRPRAVSTWSHGSGVLERDSATLDVALPSDLVRTGSQLTLDLSPSPAGMMVAAADGLFGYEWRCTEQTANALRAAAALAVALRGATAPPGWDDPASKLAPLIRRLVELQNEDGTWGWWRGTDSDPFLTALALDALARIATTGLATEDLDGPIQRAVYQLPRLLYEVRTLDGEAYCLDHLTPLLALPDAQNRFPELRARLEELALSTQAGRERLGTAGLALSARAHANLGRAAEARTLLDLLLKRAVPEGGDLHWPDDPDPESGWFGDGEENTAYALSALVRIAPQDGRAAGVVRWLARQRRGLLWRSTRTTGPVAIALSDYLARHPSEVRPDYRLRVEWNGERVYERAVGPADVFGGREMRVRIPGRSLKPGANRLTLTRQGAGSVYYTWQARALVPSPGPTPPRDLPLQITREILHAERTADRRGRPRYLATAAAPGEPFALGEQVLVRLRLRATQPLRHLIVEDPRILGFEVDALLPDGTEWPWNVHGEERDDRVAFFLERIEEGETRIEYLVRPEIPGTFTALPTEASGMYRPELHTRGEEATVEVRARK